MKTDAQAAPDGAAAKPADEVKPANVAAKVDVDGLTFPNLRTETIGPGGEPTKTLKLREPTAMDIERFGHPVLIDFTKAVPQISFDEKKMTAMLAGLADVTPISIRKLHPKDWSTMAWAVAGFFMPDME
jgi:hypothetical protein